MNPTDATHDATTADGGTRSNDATGAGRSRRAFLGATATLGAVTLAGCSSDPEGSAPTDQPMSDTPTAEPTDSPTDSPTDTPEPMNPDVPILNYALALEHLENTFYREGLETFSEDELMNADVLSKFGEQVRMDVPNYLKAVGKHEAAHVKGLTNVIEKLGGDPVGAAEYEFGYKTPSEFLAVAKALENTGVAAYAGAAPAVVDNDILTTAAGIHSVEARHASFLNFVNDESPFPRAVDKAKSMQEVLDIATQFITSEVDASAFQTEEPRPKPQRKENDKTSDIEVLNYALTLEHLENAFYREGLETFSENELMNADALSEFGEEVRTNVPEHLTAVGKHEAAHVKAITNTVKKLGGDPVEEATYDFGYGNASEFLAVAKALENTGVAAYKGAAPTVSNDTVFAAAIGIHSVEARHASFLNELNLTSPFPRAIDKPKSMKEVKQIASQFIVES